MLIYYIDDIMQIRLDEQEVATMLETLVRHALQNMGDKPLKVLACWDISFKVKDNLLHLVSPIMRKEAKILVGLFRL